MNTKIRFAFTSNINYSRPNNNFPEETDSVVLGEGFDFEDFLDNNNVRYEKDNNTYFVINDNGERTGEAYKIISEEETDEEA